MLWMKHLLSTMTVVRSMSALGLAACLALAFVPIGCTNSILMAPARYHEQNPGAIDLLPSITVERLQECVEQYGHQLDGSSYQVHVEVHEDPDGFRRKVELSGIPDSAPDLAACSRITFRQMAVSGPLRQSLREVTAAADSAAPMRNELANPLVAAEILLVLAEYAAQHGGRVVLYSVAVGVLSAVAVAGTKRYIQRTRKKCLEHYVECMATGRGNNWSESRCGTCRAVCENQGAWPSHIEMFPEGTVSCN